MVKANKKIRRLMKSRGMTLADLASALSRQVGNNITPDEAAEYIRYEKLKGEKLLTLSRIFQVTPLELSDLVVAALAEKGMDRNRAAELMGMSIASFNIFIGRIRRGKSIQTRLLVKFCEVTGKSADYFLRGGANAKR